MPGAARRRADELDDALAGRLPPLRREGAGAASPTSTATSYVDFCLGDTGAMTGHSPDDRRWRPSADAQRGRGITTMLPTEDAASGRRGAQRRFGLPYWQFTLSATDANRFALRLARQVTTAEGPGLQRLLPRLGGRDRIAVGPTGGRGRKPGNVGPPVDPAATTRVVEFNDVEALERGARPGGRRLRAHRAGDDEHRHRPAGARAILEAVRELTRETGTLLIIDETHTFCAGPGGCTRAWGSSPTS